MEQTRTRREREINIRMQETLVTIIGAGTSGIASAACLTKQSIPYIILEREDCIASLWQKYTHDRLHLHLRKQVCQLPYLPFPKSYPHYVPRKQFIEYLDNYVKHFDINPLYHRSVELAEHDGKGKWRVLAKNRASGEVEEYASKFLVVATGETAEPHVPHVEGLDSFKGKVLHSTAYKNGQHFKDEHVLVVGSGNSGMEIALDLANFGAKPSIIARSPVHFVSRDMMYYATVLAKYLSRRTVEKLLVIVSMIVYGDLSKYGIPFPSEGPFTMKIKYGKFPIIDLGTVKKIRSGEIQGGDDLLNEDGFAKGSFPNHWKGQNGLYCVGLARWGFSGASLDAQKVANDIASFTPQEETKGICVA